MALNSRKWLFVTSKHAQTSPVNLFHRYKQNTKNLGHPHFWRIPKKFKMAQKRSKMAFWKFHLKNNFSRVPTFLKRRRYWKSVTNCVFFIEKPCFLRVFLKFFFFFSIFFNFQKKYFEIILKYTFHKIFIKISQKLRRVASGQTTDRLQTFCYPIDTEEQQPLHAHACTLMPHTRASLSTKDDTPPGGGLEEGGA